MELDPPYCDVIIRPWEQFTGKKAERIEAAGETEDAAGTPPRGGDTAPTLAHVAKEAEG